MELVEAHKAGFTLFAVDCWSTAAHHCAWPTASSGWWPAAFAAPSIAILLLLLQPLLRLLRRDHPSPASSRQASLAAVIAIATLSDVCPQYVTERGAAAKILARTLGCTGSEGGLHPCTGSEGVRGMFREQSWKCCLWPSLNRCKPNLRGLGVYVCLLYTSDAADE